MLLRLAPEAPLPTILFSIVFPTLPNDLPFPTAWAHQIKELMKMSLDSPPNPHALDRSVWATTLLDQVNFDLVSNSVTCIYLDGAHIEFTVSPACRQMLIRVLGDVTDSATEAERERLEQFMPAPVIRAPPSTAFNTPSHSRRASLSAFPVMPPPPLSAPPAPPSSSSNTGTDPQPPQSPSHTSNSNHRRSRSLLSTLLSALIPSSSATVPPRAQLPTKKLTASRNLRRRARSTLVDCFRAHVLPEINSHLATAGRWGAHGYAVWACTSMLGRVEAMIQYELDQAGGASGGSASHRKRDSAMILDYHESPFDDPEHPDAKSGELVGENGEVKALRQHADGLRGCANTLLMREHMIQNDERDALMMLEIRARRRAWSTKSRGGGGQRWMGLGTPLRPSRLAFSWTPDSMEYDPADTDTSLEFHEHQRQHPRYTVRLPSEEIEQWSERIIVDENGYHMKPSTSASPSSPPMHPADKSGSSTSTLDFDALDETIICESPDAADLDSEDEDEELVNEGGGETILPRELELPPGLHGPANGRRGRASYYLPRPPAEVVNTANGTNSPYRYRPGCATNMVYEDNPSFSSSSPSKPGLSLKFPHSHGCEGDRAALSLDSPTQAIPQDAVDLESFGNGDIVVGTVGVPQDVGLGVLCPLTPIPAPSSARFFADEDYLEGPDIEVDANMVVDGDTDGEREPSLSPSHSSDSASVNTVSTGSEELVKVAMAQVHVRTPGSSRDGGEVVDTTEDPDSCGKPLRPPRNPSRLAKGEIGTTGTSEDVTERAFAY